VIALFMHTMSFFWMSGGIGLIVMVERVRIFVGEAVDKSDDPLSRVPA